MRVKGGDRACGKLIVGSMLAIACAIAFGVRSFRLLKHGPGLHDLDAYANFRIAKFVEEKGTIAQFGWKRDVLPANIRHENAFDATYPGIAIVATYIHRIVGAESASLENVCALLGPSFAAASVLIIYGVAKEVAFCFREPWSKNSPLLFGIDASERVGLLSALLLSVIPGFYPRSIAGSFDGDSMAVPAMLSTFYFWSRASRGKTGFVSDAFAAAASSFAVACSSKQYHVLTSNIVAIHVALCCIVLGRSARLFPSNVIFYLFSALFASIVPAIGWQHVYSLDYALPLCVFAWTLVRRVSSCYFHFGETRSRANLALAIATVSIAGFAYLGGAVAPMSLETHAILNPFYTASKHPLLFSVPDNQPTTWARFFFDLHAVVFFVPVGFYFLLGSKRAGRFGLPVEEGNLLLVTYGIVTLYAAASMVRLVIVFTPPACILSALAASSILEKYAMPFLAGSAEESGDRKGKGAIRTKARRSRLSGGPDSSQTQLEKKETAVVAVIVAVGLLGFFFLHCMWVARTSYSDSSVSVRGRHFNHTISTLDDIRESMEWIEKNTNSGAKIMAWADYGHVLSSLAKRTAVVDSWSTQDNVAEVARAFASPPKEGAARARSLGATHVMVTFGGYAAFTADDVSKFQWMARIVASTNPTFSESFLNHRGKFKIDDTAPESVLHSWLYRLCFYRFGNTKTEIGRSAGFDRVRRTGIGLKEFGLDEVDEVFTSKNWVVRIYRLRPGSVNGREG